MDTRPADTTLEESAPAVDAQQQLQQQSEEISLLRQENATMREEMAELRRVVATLSTRLTTVEARNGQLQQSGAATFDALVRLSRKVDVIGQDIAVSINEFDLGRYDVI